MSIEIHEQAPAIGAIDVSIIVPLESHRGQALACIKQWALDQTYPRERYQILVAAPTSLDQRTAQQIRSYLKPWDWLDLYRCEHDIGLMAQVAARAKGRFLVFTESHCLPQSIAITHLMEIATARPEWAGFSSASTPIAPNFLSEIEADIYGRDIHAKFMDDSALKVVDQCFLIRKEIYFSCGGFEPKYGHFAEWLLGASLRRDGHKIGVDFKPVIAHLYTGNQAELKAFTLDFARGQIRFFDENPDDSRLASFIRLPELDEICERIPADFYDMASLRYSALKFLVVQGFQNRGNVQTHVAKLRLVIDFLEWGIKWKVGPKGSSALASLAEINARLRMNLTILRADRAATREAYINWFGKLVRQGRLAYLAQTIRPRSHQRNLNFSRSGKWRPDSNQRAELLGFYERETVASKTFCWSMQCACVYLPLHVGRYRIVIEWENVRQMTAPELILLECDDVRVATSKIALRSTSLLLEIDSDFRGWHRLAWSVIPFIAYGDRRLLGLPISQIHWFALDTAVVDSLCDTGLARQDYVNYFLHVPKSAGTTTRLLLDNAFNASVIFSPYGGSYYQQDLLDNPKLEHPYLLYRGHFGWHLPDCLPSNNLNVLAIMREPVDRIISKFYYDQRLGRINPNLNLMEWLEHDINFSHTAISHFTSAMWQKSKSCESDSIRIQSLKAFPEAAANLLTCQIVGLTEKLEETINLFAWELGFLPPLLTAHNNNNLNRIAAKDISARLHAKISHLFEADIALYQQCITQFELAHARMVKALPHELGLQPETTVIRAWLRQCYIERMANKAAASVARTQFEWHPDDVFHGENLHERELDNGNILRWTGPNQTTRFYIPLGLPRKWIFRIRLHPATPDTHISATTLQINGCSIPVDLDMTSGDYVLVASIPHETVAIAENNVSMVELTAPVVRGAGEFRLLGLGLLHMSWLAE
ncbi:MAG: hypothetical protein V4805_00350 [Pseudomonadota bacterium]